MRGGRQTAERAQEPAVAQGALLDVAGVDAVREEHWVFRQVFRVEPLLAAHASVVVWDIGRVVVEGGRPCWKSIVLVEGIVISAVFYDTFFEFFDGNTRSLVLEV